MNYTFQNRKQRCLHIFRPANVTRGVVYPTIKDFYMRLRNGEDLSRYLADTPFTGDTVYQFEDYLDLVQRNRVMLDQLAKLRINSVKEKDEEKDHKKVDAEDEDVKDADDKETSE